MYVNLIGQKETRNKAQLTIFMYVYFHIIVSVIYLFSIGKGIANKPSPLPILASWAT